MLQSPISPHRTVRSDDNKGWRFQEGVSGVVFRSLSLDSLIGEIEKHRFAIAGKNIEVDLASGWQQRLLNAICQQNPNAQCGPNPLGPDFEPSHVAIGRALWKELHDMAETDFDPYQLRDWFNKWIERAPSYHGCRCRENAIQLLASMPPDFSKEGFKPWCSRFHDSVSQRLGKKPWAQRMADEVARSVA